MFLAEAAPPWKANCEARDSSEASRSSAAAGNPAELASAGPERPSCDRCSVGSCRSLVAIECIQAGSSRSKGAKSYITVGVSMYRRGVIFLELTFL